MQIGILVHDATLTPTGHRTFLCRAIGLERKLVFYRDTDRRRGTARRRRGSGARRSKGRTHDFSVGGEVASRRLTGRIAESPVIVTDTARPRQCAAWSSARRPRWPRATARSASPSAMCGSSPAACRLDGGARLDHSRHGGGVPSGESRCAIRPRRGREQLSSRRATAVSSGTCRCPCRRSPTTRGGWIVGSIRAADHR